MNLTRNQMTVLTILLDGEKYGLEVIKEAKESGVHLLLGSFYNVTTTLEKKGLVKSYEGKTTDERGGNNRRYYKITAAGEYELRNYVSGLSKFLNWLNPKLNINLFGILLFFLLLMPSSIQAANWGQYALTNTFYILFLIVFVFISMYRGTKFRDQTSFISSFVVVTFVLNTFCDFSALVSFISKHSTLFFGMLLWLVTGIFFSIEKFAVKIITYFGYIIPRKRRKEIVGDLLEDYYETRKEKNTVFALLVTIFHMVSLARISIDRAKFSDYGSEVEASKDRKGVVKMYTDKGFGFITINGEKDDCSFHVSELVNVDSLNPGDIVSFLVEEGLKGIKATNIYRE